MFNKIKNIMPGMIISIFVAIMAIFLNRWIPNDVIGATVIALIIGMLLNPFICKESKFEKGINFTGKMILRLGIILMGVNLNFSEVLGVSSYALFVMLFTFITAFGVGNLLGKFSGLNWKITNLLSISTAICGGTAVATVGPVIKAENKDIAYAISATFLFDIITVIIFPMIGMALGMSDFGYGIWSGTAVNDTSSVVAAGYGFSEAAGNVAVIVKLTRTLFIIPFVLIFSVINERIEAKELNKTHKVPINWQKIFPYFILLFLLMVILRSVGIIDNNFAGIMSKMSKFFMIMALGAIGLQTSFKEIKQVGIKPMVIGVIVDTLVVFVSLAVIKLTGKF